MFRTRGWARRAAIQDRNPRAIFLDRDGALSRNSPQKARERDKAIARLIGREDIILTDVRQMDVFWRVCSDSSTLRQAQGGEHGRTAADAA